MVQLHELYKEIRKTLAASSAEHAAREAALLLAHALKIEQSQLHLNPEAPVSPAQVRRAREWVKRRVTGEPVQYIIGHQEFWSLDFLVEPGVLIPRPESEFLVEAALALAPHRVVEVGTGSGAIAVALAVHAPQSLVWATDISRAALRIARVNCCRHKVADRVFFYHGHLLEPLVGLGLEGRVDVMISNPPYVRSQDLWALPCEVRDYEPSQALDGGADGLFFYRQLAKHHAWLRTHGKLLLEVGHNQAGPVSELLAENGWALDRIIKDYRGVERTIVASVRRT